MIIVAVASLLMLGAGRSSINANMKNNVPYLNPTALVDGVWETGIKARNAAQDREGA